MKKHICSWLASVVLIFLLTYNAFAQPPLAAGYRYSEEGSIQISEKNWHANTTVSFAVYLSDKVTALGNGAQDTYKAGDVLGFTLKSGKQFISASQGKLLGTEFVEDLTPNFTKLKVVKGFEADDPLMQKDSVIMGTWLHYMVFVKPDGSRQMVSGFKKIGELVKADCPELSKKILAKEKGYYLGLLAGTSKEELEIYHRIATEFDQCKK